MNLSTAAAKGSANKEAKRPGDDAIILVTVGSTSFPKLTDFVTAAATVPSLLALCDAHGAARVVVQHGRHVPSNIDSTQASRVHCVDYVPSLGEWMRRARAVVSHAGAGTVLEAVDAGVPLVVVVNSALMDNHQTELAYAMQRRGCCDVVDQRDITSQLLPALTRQLQRSNRQSQSGQAYDPPVRNAGVISSVISQELA